MTSTVAGAAARTSYARDDPVAQPAPGPAPAAETPAVLCLRGRLDATSVAAAREALAPLVGAGEADLWLDCSGLEWVDVTGLALLTSMHRRLRLADRRLVLMGCQPQLRRALAVTRLNRVLVTQDTVGPELPSLPS